MDMIERFTDRSRKVMALANQEAQRFNHEYIGTEHILIGLVKEGSGLGATVLKNNGVVLQKLRREVEKLVKRGTDMITTGKLPQTPLAKKVIEYAIEEAKSLNHNYVGTEHLLLGLVKETDGIHAKAMRRLGLNFKDIRQEVLNMLGAGLDDDPEERHAKRNYPSFEDSVPLTLLIDPGDASAEELSELFVEISTLYRMVGGSGVNFTIVDAKELAIA